MMKRTCGYVMKARGFRKGELKRIFEEFYRCRNGVNETQNRGAGLGLAIVARMQTCWGQKCWWKAPPQRAALSL